MTTTKLTFAALFLGASLVPAFANTDDQSQSPRDAYLASLAAAPVQKPVVEGRQATPIHATVTETAAERYVEQRNLDTDR